MAGKTFSVTAILGVNSSRMAKGLKGAARSMTTWAKATMVRVAALIKAGMLIAGAAVGIFATKSIKHFASFERGMNEVFTLLPGITKDAMGKMEADVLNLATKMGILPDEVIPALYQALSAGVPASNVFKFLETAAKSSLGGVASLTEAVDVLSSVTNAYGPSNLSAADAADILFTTVAAGKTNFALLNASLYNVVPAAAAAGVSFEQVGAAVALLTSKGTPTSVATTQIRAAILSMFAPNKAMVKAFEESGMSVEKLGKIMKTGQILPALQMVMRAANGDTSALKRMFGSVEALQAALQITGNQGKDFADKLAQLAARAGSSTAAFQGMDKGISRSWERIATGMRVAMIKMGKALSPFVQAAVPTIMRIIEMIGQIPWTKMMQGFSNVWLVGIRPHLWALAQALIKLPWSNLYSTLRPVAELVITTIQKIIKIAIALTPAIVPGIGVLGMLFIFMYRNFFILIAIVNRLAPSLGKIFKDVFEIMRTAFLFFMNPTKANFKAFMTFTKTKLKELWKHIKELGLEVLKMGRDVWRKFKGTMITLFGEMFEELKAKFQKFLDDIPGWNAAVKTFGDAWKIIKEELLLAWKDLKEGLAEVFAGMQTGANDTEELKASTRALVKDIFKLIATLVVWTAWGLRVVSMIGSLIAHFFKFSDGAARGEAQVGGLAAAIKLLVDILRGVVSVLIGVTKMFTGFFMLFVKLKPLIKEIGEFVILTLEGIPAEARRVWGAMKKGVEDFVEFFYQAWRNIKGSADKFWQALKKMFNDFKEVVYHVLFGGTVTKDFKEAFDYISKLVTKVMDKIKSVFKTVFDGVKMGLDGLQKVFKTFGDFVNRIFDKILSVGGKAMDLAKGVLKAAGGVFGGIMDKVTGGGGKKGGGGNARPARGQSELSAKNQAQILTVSLKPIVAVLTSMDSSLKSIDTTLKGKFVNQ